MNCNHCGEPIEEGTKFCPNCGNKIEAVEAVTETVSEAAEEAVEEVKETVTEEVTEQVNEEKHELERVYDAGDDSTAEPNKPVDSNLGGFAEDADKAEKKPDNGMGFSIASLTCGILGILCCSCCGIGIVFSVAGIVLGIISLNKNYDGKGLAIAGIACGAVGLLVGLPIIISYSSGLSSAGNIGNIVDEFVESL